MGNLLSSWAREGGGERDLARFPTRPLLRVPGAKRTRQKGQSSESVSAAMIVSNTSCGVRTVFLVSRMALGIGTAIVALKLDGDFEASASAWASAFFILTMASLVGAFFSGRIPRAFLLMDASCLVSHCFSAFFVLFWIAGRDSSARDQDDLWIRLGDSLPIDRGYGAVVFAFALLGVAAKTLAYGDTHSEMGEAPFFVARLPLMLLGLVALILVPLVHSASFVLLLAASDWIARHPFEGCSVAESLLAVAAWTAAGTGILVPFAWLSTACEKLEKRTIGVALCFFLSLTDALFWIALAAWTFFAGVNANRLRKTANDSPWLALMKGVQASPVGLVSIATALLLFAVVKVGLAFVLRRVGGARFHTYDPVRRDSLDDPTRLSFQRGVDAIDDDEENPSRTSVPSSASSSASETCECQRSSSVYGDSVPPSPTSRPALLSFSRPLPVVTEEPADGERDVSEEKQG